MPTPWDPYRPASVSGDEKPSVTKPTETPAEPAVPQGTSAEVLAWVGDDKAKAKRALEVEESTEKPRKGLVSDLKDLLSA